MPPVRFVVVRVPLESKTPNRRSVPPLGPTPVRENVVEARSLSPTDNVTGPPSVKNPQKPSLDVLAGLKVTEPGASVRTVVARPLNTRIEVGNAWFWLFASANVSSTRTAAFKFRHKINRQQSAAEKVRLWFLIFPLARKTDGPRPTIRKRCIVLQIKM